MINEDQSLQKEFVEEALEIIRDMGAACSSIHSAKNPEELLEIIERGLHTIKGNASALGFEQYSKAAKVVLDIFRETKKNNDLNVPSQFVIGLVFRFVTISHQFLFLTRNFHNPTSDFFKEIFDSAFDKGNEESNVSEVKKEENTSLVAEFPTEVPEWEAEVKAILDTAPLVMPDVQALLQMATDELAKIQSKSKEPNNKTQLVIPKTVLQRPSNQVFTSQSENSETKPLRNEKIPPNTASIATNLESPKKVEKSDTEKELVDFDGSSSSLVYGFGFESWCIYQSIKSLIKSDEEKISQIEQFWPQVAEFLTIFSQWALNSHKVSFAYFLKDAATWGEQLAKSYERTIKIQVVGEDVTVLPAVGDLINNLIKEVLYLAMPMQGKDWEFQSETTISLKAEVKSGCVIVRVGGFPYVQRTTTKKLRLYSLSELLENIGGRISQDQEQNQIVIEVRDKNLYSLPVLIVRMGRTLVGIPGHRVLHVRAWKISDDVFENIPNRCIEYNGKKVKVLNLDKGNSTVSTGESSELPASVLILNTDMGQRALIVNKIIYCHEMLVKPADRISTDEDIVGFCISLNENKLIPLLGPSLR